MPRETLVADADFVIVSCAVFTLTLAGVVVKLPEKNWQKELTTLEHLIIDEGVLERDITEIDLRSKNAIFFMLKSGEQKSTVRGDKI